MLTRSQERALVLISKGQAERAHYTSRQILCYRFRLITRVGDAWRLTEIGEAILSTLPKQAFKAS
jgi:hypothetical protein